MGTRCSFAGYKVAVEWSELDDSTLSNTDDKNAWSCTSTPPLTSGVYKFSENLAASLKFYGCDVKQLLY